jgi:hypothetical protein
MGRTPLPERFQIKLSVADRASLEALAATLSLDMGSTIRFLIAEKCRVLGITAPTPAKAAPKKKRRAGS